MSEIKLKIHQIIKIANIVNTKYELTNNRTYYSIVDRITKETSLESNSMVFNEFKNFIELHILELSNLDHSCLDWQIVGVKVSSKNEKYVYSVINMIVESLCGYEQL